MLQQMFGTQLAFPIRVAVAAIVIAALLGLTVLVMRRLANRGSAGERRGRAGPRLSVLDSIPVDPRRRLVLIRRDEVEHLLLIGGNSDIVIEQNIGVADAEEVTPAPAAVAPPREAPSLQRPSPRRPLSAAPAAAALPAEPVAASLPAPEAAPADAPAAEPREERRSALARRPLLRGDGTLSGRSAARTAAETAPETAVAKPDQARLDALKAEFAASTPRMDLPRIEAAKAEAAKAEAAKAEAARIETPRNEAPRIETPRIETGQAEDAPPAVSEVAAELEDLTHRLDAALVHPPAAAAPQISLSDLLGDMPEPAAEKPAATPVELAPAPRTEPVIEAPPSPARASEGPLSRFLSQSRNRSAEPRPQETRPLETRPLEPRPRVDAVPRAEAPSRSEAPPRVDAPVRSETPLRPREFSFRPGGESRPLPTPDQPRREPLALRDLSRDEAPRPEVSSPLLRAPSPTVTPVSTDLAAPVVAAPVAAPPSDDAPRVEPDAPRDPLDDFDAEMANLLGRTNARGR